MTYSLFLQGSLPLLVELDMRKRADAAGDKGVAPSPTPTAPPARVSPGPNTTTPARPKRPGGIPKPGDGKLSPAVEALLKPNSAGERDFQIRLGTGSAGARA